MDRIKEVIKQFKRWWRFRFKEYALQSLLRETGIRIDPEPGVFGVLSGTEEQEILARLWKDPLFIPLLRKYAEGANAAMTMAVKAQNNRQADRFNAQFFTYSSMIVKAKRASQRLNEATNNPKV